MSGSKRSFSVAMAGGGRVSYEASVMHRDGSRRDVMLIKVAVPGDDGGPSGILTVLMDVSEFRVAERATRDARDVAEEASRAKTEFISNISHELRTPLQSILGFSELGMVRGRQHEKLASMFTDIHNSGQRMLALVNDLLDVSKIESTVGTFHLERTDLRTLGREVAREIERVFEAFVQSSQTKDGSGGTGLGLAICRKILEAHGGRIHAESLAGGGAVFHIHVPARGGVETAPVPL